MNQSECNSMDSSVVTLLQVKKINGHLPSHQANSSKAIEPGPPRHSLPGHGQLLGHHPSPHLLLHLKLALKLHTHTNKFTCIKYTHMTATRSPLYLHLLRRKHERLVLLKIFLHDRGHLLSKNTSHCPLLLRLLAALLWR